MMSLRRNGLLLLACGMLYISMEVVARAVRGELVGWNNVSYLSLAGWSSMWMVLIGGICGLAMVSLGRGGKIKVLWLQCLIGAVLVLGVELMAGLLLNNVLDLSLWSYEGWPLNILGQITLLYLPVWFLLCPVAVWIDMVIGYVFFSEANPGNLISQYLRLFQGR